MMRKENTLYGIIATIALIFFVLTAAIAVPLVCRPFYYAHIQGLHLPETTGYTEQEIRDLASFMILVTALIMPLWAYTRIILPTARFSSTWTSGFWEHVP